MKHQTLTLLFIVAAISSLSCAQLVENLSQDQEYNFRKTRWGMSQAQVELSEVGNKVVWRTPEEIIYETNLEGVPVQIIYTFDKKKRLRIAGYITRMPVKRADKLVEQCIAKHGEPTMYSDGMIWENLDSVIYSQSYTSFISIADTKYRDSQGGALAHLQRERHSNPITTRSDAMFTYIDTQFWNELHEMDNPLSELSSYEKQMLGIILKRTQIQIR